MKVSLHNEDGVQTIWHTDATNPLDAIRDAWHQYRAGRGYPGITLTVGDGQLPPPWAQAHILIPRVHRGSHDRVYGGDPNLVHIPDGTRRDVGRKMAYDLTLAMLQGSETATYGKALCPGCYMIAGFNMLVTLARENGQNVRELALSMAHAFDKLASAGDYSVTEEIEVMLDPPVDAIHFAT